MNNAIFSENYANGDEVFIEDSNGLFSDEEGNRYSFAVINGEKNDIHNVGSVIFKGNAVLDGGITGTGEVLVNNGALVDVLNGELIQNDVSIAQGGELRLNNANISIKNAIQNSGILTIKGDGNISQAITMNNGSTLDILNGEVNNVSNINIQKGASVNMAIDFKDTINPDDATKVMGDIVLTKIDMSDIKASDTSVITNTIANNIIFDKNIEFINQSSESAPNYVTLDKAGTVGKLIASRNILYGAITDTLNEQRIYEQTENETITTASMVGNLVVKGSGQTVTSASTDVGGGIQVGDGKTANNSLSFVDVNFDGVKVNDDKKGAFTVAEGNELIIKANDYDVVIENTIGNAVNNAIYLEGSDTNKSKASLISNSLKTIIIKDDIRSDHQNNELVLTGAGVIKLYGVLDPLTINTDAGKVYRYNQDDSINWNLNGGTLIYAKDGYLSGGTNSINFNGGSLDLRNGVASTINLAGLTLSESSNLYLDVDLANNKMDEFNTTSVNTPNSSAILHVAGLNLISDATKYKTTINFVSDKTLAGYVDYTGTQGITALSPISKYNVAYDKSNGDFNFTRFAGGGYKSFNPAVMASPIAAQLGGYLTQLNSYDQAFRNMDMYMLMTKKQRETLKLRNKYAAADSKLIFEPTNSIYNDKSVWVRPYTTFENVPLKNGPKVSNVAYGSFFGAESELYDLGRGWDGMYGVYVGYNGSHQAYDGIGINQNGGTLGLIGMAYKGNFFTGLTLNTGASVGEASTMYGADNFTMLMAGIANKTGYNIELADGKFIIQPGFQLSYSFVNTFDYKNVAGVKINSDPLNTIQIEPGIKFIGNLKKGWQPYAGVSMVWNIMDKTNFYANNVSLPELSIKPYVRYGIGVRKTLGKICTGFIQTYITNGGRNGIGFQLGFRFALGKDDSTPIKTSNNMPELPKAQINLSRTKLNK